MRQAVQMLEPLTGATALPDGTQIRGRGRRKPLPAGPLPDFGLYLGRPPDQPRRPVFGRRPGWQPDWSADWIDWPDFRAPHNDGSRQSALNTPICSPGPANASKSHAVVVSARR